MIYGIIVLLNCTWGIIQTIAGAVVFILNHKNNEHFFYKGVIVTKWSRKAGLSLGLFIFVPPTPRFYNCEKYHFTDEDLQERLIVHEYGHSVQSSILGSLYFIVIGLTSSIWSFCQRINESEKKDKVSYFTFYTEKWANYLGEKVTGKKSMENIDI